jgi:hypothetical protein
MNKEEFWEKMYERLDDPLGLVNIRLNDGRIVYNIRDAEDDPENEYAVTLYREWPEEGEEDGITIFYHEIDEVILTR